MTPEMSIHIIKVCPICTTSETVSESKYLPEKNLDVEGREAGILVGKKILILSVWEVRACSYSLCLSKESQPLITGRGGLVTLTLKTVLYQMGQLSAPKCY